MNRKKFTYKIIGTEIDIDGWFKYNVLRSDGKEVKIQKSRVKILRKEGRIS